MNKEDMKEMVQEKHWVINILLENNKIQLEKRTEKDKPMYGYIIIPGGSIDTSETQKEAAERETLEEYGIKALDARKIGTVQNIGPNSGTCYFRHVFLITKWEGELSNPENRNEHIDVPLEVAREICKHPVFQQILDLLDRELSGQNA